MKTISEESAYFCKDKNDFFDLNIFLKEEALVVKINELQLSYTYGEMIDCDKRFRGFDSIKEIYLFILSLALEQKITLAENKALILKGWEDDITIPFKIQPPLVNLNIIDESPPQIIKTKPQEGKSLQDPFFGLRFVKKINDKNEINSLCFLKDGRLVSLCGLQVEMNAASHSNNFLKDTIVVYNKDTYKSEVVIEDDGPVTSICGLRNGNLAFSSFSEIKIWEIKETKCKNVQSLRSYFSIINKVIEFQDGKLCACSTDKTIKIFSRDNSNYKCVQILKGHNNSVNSVIEMNNFIVSSSADFESDFDPNSNDNSVKIWDKSTYECVKTIEKIYSYSLSKLKEDTIIIKGKEKLFMLDLFSFEIKSVKNNNLGVVYSICALRNGKLLLGNNRGEIICFAPLSNKIIYIQRLHNQEVASIIEGENSQIFSSSYNTINIYEQY